MTSKQKEPKTTPRTAATRDGSTSKGELDAVKSVLGNEGAKQLDELLKGMTMPGGKK